MGFALRCKKVLVYSCWFKSNCYLFLLSLCSYFLLDFTHFGSLSCGFLSFSLSMFVMILITNFNLEPKRFLRNQSLAILLKWLMFFIVGYYCIVYMKVIPIYWLMGMTLSYVIWFCSDSKAYLESDSIAGRTAGH